MPKKYTTDEIISRLEAAKAENSVYTMSNLFNYKGTTKDTKDKYSEVISEWLCRNLDAVMTIPSKTRKGSYRVLTHDGTTPRKSSNRQEERIAMEMFNQRNLPLLGCVLDYQTPLANGRCASIDLLTHNGTTLHLLELKKPYDITIKHKETMLRCVMEIYAYSKHVNIPQLLGDFQLPADTIVRASPLVPYNGYQHNELKQERPHLKALMKALDIIPFYYKKVGDQYAITQ